MLGYTVAKVCTSPRNSTWFTRQFLLVRGWGLKTRLLLQWHRKHIMTGSARPWMRNYVWTLH